MRQIAWLLMLIGCTVEPASDVGIVHDNTCVATAPPTIPATSNAICDPLAQTGCASGEKCAWIIDVKTDDEWEPTEGHVGCVPDGPVAVGCACTVGQSIGKTYDDCAKGSGCRGDLCEAYCDPAADVTGCANGYMCAKRSSQFADPDHPVGFCTPRCDPITQEALVGDNRTACGSVSASSPNRGCYEIGWGEFGCAMAGDLALVDHELAKASPEGRAYANGCAPGFIPLSFHEGDSAFVTTRCFGVCSPLDIDQTRPFGAKGNWTVPGKLPTLSNPILGGATCNTFFKAAGTQSECRYLWPFVTTDSTSPLVDPTIHKVGFCFAYREHKYDSDGDRTRDRQHPSCTDLPPRTAQTTGERDDAGDFNCYSRETINAIPQPARFPTAGHAPSRAVRTGLSSLAR